MALYKANNMEQKPMQTHLYLYTYVYRMEYRERDKSKWDVLVVGHSTEPQRPQRMMPIALIPEPSALLQ